jgi:hypothetical protein
MLLAVTFDAFARIDPTSTLRVDARGLLHNSTRASCAVRTEPTASEDAFHRFLRAARSKRPGPLFSAGRGAVEEVHETTL